MANWPTSLPAFRLPLSTNRQDGTLRTSMDAGPEKVRRRFSATSKFYSISIQMEGADLSTLEEFYETTLQGGSVTFDMEDPVSGVEKEFRFAQPYEIRQVVGGEIDKGVKWDQSEPSTELDLITVNTGIYDVQLNLEMLP